MGAPHIPLMTVTVSNSSNINRTFLTRGWSYILYIFILSVALLAILNANGESLIILTNLGVGGFPPRNPLGLVL